VVQSVRTLSGKSVYRRPAGNHGRIVEERHVAMMNTMLAETLASGTARRAEPLPFPAAGKTGTSQDYRDAWFVGYSANLVAGVWLGNDDNTPTRRTTGGGLPVDIWSRFMRVAQSASAVGALAGTTRSAPAQPAASQRQGVPPAESMRLDQWLIERVFGGR
jgi:penicillin-binding protein 1A